MFFVVSSNYGQCAYPSSATQAGSTDYMFCIDNSNTITAGSIRAGRYIVLNVISGFTYTFSGNIFTGNEEITIFNATNNAYVGAGGFASGGNTNLTWKATFSGRIKILLTKTGCVSDNTNANNSLTITLDSLANNIDDQTAAGTDIWKGHLYNWTSNTLPPGGSSPLTPPTTTPFSNAEYAGYYDFGSETIGTTYNFNGDTGCFNVFSDGVQRANIYPETFAVRYRMKSTRPAGCYLVTLRGDDGVRLYVDNVRVFDEWKEQSSTEYANVLVYLKGPGAGGSDLILDYYENGGQNQVSFSIVPFDANSNTIVAPSPSVVCSGVQPNTIDGSSYLYNNSSINPTIKYQWQTATNINGPWNDISGATLEDYRPGATTTTTSPVVNYYRRVVSAAASNASACTWNSNVISITTGIVGTPTAPTSGLASNITCSSFTANWSSITAATSYRIDVATNNNFAAGNMVVSNLDVGSVTSFNVTGLNTATTTYYYRVRAYNGCGGTTSAVASSNIITVVLTSPTVTISGTAMVCQNASAPNVSFTNSQNSAITVTYKINGGANTTVNVPANGTTNISVTTTANGTFTYSLVSAAYQAVPSCTQTLSGSAVITVNPNPTATAGPALSAICQGATSAAMGGSVGGGATGGTWTGGSGTWTNAADPVNATYTAGASESGSIILTLTTSGGSCGTATATKTITVNPNPTANAGAALSAICQGATSAAMGGSVGGGATGGTWTGGSGTWTNAADPANATYTAGASESGSITLTLTTSGGSCGTATATKTITVNPNPTATAGSALSAICQGAVSAAMGGSVGGGATGGTWTGGSGTWTNAADPVNATYTAGASESGSITLTLTTSGGSCGTATATKTITVNPNPTANAGSALSAICQGATSAPMGGSVGGGATGGTWTGGSGTWTNAADPVNATYTAGASESGSIILTLTTSGGLCNTISVTKTITVIQAPIPSIVKNGNVSCGSFGSITVDTLPADWTINQTGLTTLPKTYSGTTSTLPIQDLTADTYSFTVTDNATGCTSSSASVTIDDISSFTEWNGSGWTNNEPDGSKSVIISSVVPNQPFPNVTPLPKTNIDACSLEIRVPAGSEVVIPSGLTLTITNAVTSNGRLVFRNGSSLIQKTDVQNSGNIVYERETSVRRFDLTYWSSPVTVSPDLGPKMNELSPTTLFDKYFYFEPIAGWKTNLYGGMSMKVGNGYSIRGPQGFDTAVPSIFTGKFVGVPNNGNITVKSVVADKYFFFGNPYPSAIDADALIETNKDVLGTIYLWTHVTSPQKAPGDNTYRYTSDDYIAYNISGTTSVGNNGAPAKPFDGFIAAGQGFLARPKTTEILFNNAMRVEANNGQFLKTAKRSIEKNRIWLNITNTQGAFKQILVGYIQGATNSVDINYDAFSAAGNSFIDFYSINETKKLTIQGRALPFDNSDLVPLGYKTAIEGEFTIAIDHGDGFFNTQEVFLEDKTTGKITNLRNENYTFSTLTGTFADRFVLRYTNKTLGTGDFENLESSVLVSVKDKVISITSSKETIKEVNIFDVGAQSLYSKKKVNSSELQINNLHSSDQVLLVKVTLENGSTITKKVVFSNL
ncbi:RemA [Flavobacterium anhuiense]|uniref:RemA n=2 Tax=Flavobacterium anhuiense TaxID=459526 RepID=A0A444W191_9FLAO|nr:RemA [Flavobacterium anhuiense]